MPNKITESKYGHPSYCENTQAPIAMHAELSNEQTTIKSIGLTNGGRPKILLTRRSKIEQKVFRRSPIPNIFSF